jgi:CDP-diacylglycerol--glycerol-3-phosphate 3-phosphatidyltransferase
MILEVSENMHITRNFPLLLTFLRLTILPCLLTIGISRYLTPGWNVGLALLYVLTSLTDFFDGFFARRWGRVTQLGAVLDPLADKIVMVTVFINLIAAHRLQYLVVLLLLVREFWVMGLRLIAIQEGFSVPVAWSGKLKTALQDIFIFLLILAPLNIAWLHFIKFCLLSFALFCSIGSGFYYTHRFFLKLNKRHTWNIH